MNAISQTGHFLLDLLFPIICFECGGEGSYLCNSCQNKFQPPEQRCFLCKKGSTYGKTHAECRSQDTALDGLIVIGDYHSESVKNLVWNLKYNFISPISEILGTLMTDYFINADITDYFAGSVVASVPLARFRERIRGYNQSELIAKKFSQNLGYEYKQLLNKIKKTKRQVDLTREERIENLKNAFEAPPDPSIGARKIIIVDDVATTGTTLNECAKTIRRWETSEIWGLVVARN
jgi:competence protein ComFC